MQLNELAPQYKPKRKKRIGRGGKRGTYCGKGNKGQNSRAGAKIRPAIRDMIKKIPKKRGYRFKPFKKRIKIINLKDLNRHFSSGDKITPKILLDKGLITLPASQNNKAQNKMPEVKILGAGKITKKLIIEGCAMSESVKKIINKE